MAQGDQVTIQGLETTLAEQVKRAAWTEVLDTANLLLAEAPKHEAALRDAVRAATSLGLVKEGLHFCDRILEIDPQDSLVWHMSAICAVKSGDSSAYSRAQRACRLEPGSPKFERTLRTIVTQAVPTWHFSMMNDASRNFAYADAIARHVKGKLVLEIGTGGGLLAMLAARSGAQRVITCEANAVLADVARQIVALNGLSDIVTVVPKMSTDLLVGVDLPEKADVLITETFTSLVIGEEAQDSLVDARARLLKHDALSIPAVARCCGALVSSDSLAKLVRVEKVLGFDVTPMNRFVPNGVALQAPASDITWMSEAADFFTFDLNRPSRVLKGNARAELTATSSGRASGVLAWMRLDLDDQMSFENRPIPDVGWMPHWTPYFFPFSHPLPLRAGQSIAFDCFYSRLTLTLDLSSFVLSSPKVG